MYFVYSLYVRCSAQNSKIKMHNFALSENLSLGLDFVKFVLENKSSNCVLSTTKSSSVAVAAVSNPSILHILYPPIFLSCFVASASPTPVIFSHPNSSPGVLPTYVSLAADYKLDPGHHHIIIPLLVSDQKKNCMYCPNYLSYISSTYYKIFLSSIH